MKVVRKHKNKCVKFSSLNIGDVFSFNSQSSVYMKIGKIEGSENAIDLNYNELVSVCSEIMVEVINGSFVENYED